MKTPLNAFAVSLWLIEHVLLRAFLEADLSTIIQMCFNFEIERKQSSFSPFLINEPVILAYFKEFHRGQKKNDTFLRLPLHMFIVDFERAVISVAYTADEVEYKWLEGKPNIFWKFHFSAADV